MTGRFVIVGLGGARSPWFSNLTRWSTTGLVGAEYTKALSADEVLAILGAGRKVSALIVSGSTPGLDRDFVSVVNSFGVAVLVVDDGHTQRDWESLGAASVLPMSFGPDELAEDLERNAQRIDPTSRRSSRVSVSFTSQDDIGALIAVTGAGGAGVSTISMALSQGLAALSGARTVALADLTRRCDLAMYHDVGDVIPGLPELVEAHRGDTPDPDRVREFLFDIDSRNYDLLLGQRRSRDSAAMAPLSTAAAIDGLRRSYDIVVADSDPTVDGESDTGSVDIELFNSAQRHAFSVASVVIVVVQPGIRGLRRLAGLVSTLGNFGVPAARLVPVINQAPRSAPAKASLTRLIADLNPLDDSIHPAVFVKSIKLLEDIHHQADALPRSVSMPLAVAVDSLLSREGKRNGVSATKVAATVTPRERSRVA
ncbi:MAG: hypothetical protein KDB26_00750 [Microthrixaceae bacterium]|nr:hypothetical protein [Microthrixaceae bacterium]